MNLVKNMFLLFVSLLGFPAGFLLGRFTQEELKPGLKYFRALQLVLLAVFIVLVLLNYNIILVFLLLAIIFFLYLKFYAYNYLQIIVYLVMYITIFFSHTDHYWLFSVAFIYSLPTGTIYYKNLFDRIRRQRNK
ncbi:hypothetical protein JW930_07590 [Candidatus Woesearchaeota archaeon]|nr:hypothetical protein [Candidatus Woesearchaeota archaeon]